jgi:hypothetical protein
MAEAPMIGHVIIDCTRCGEPRHIPVTCESVPISRPGTYTWSVRRAGRQVGEMHLDFGVLPDKHQCPNGPTAPVGALRLVKPSGEGDTQ